MNCENTFYKKDPEEKDLPDFLIEEADETSKSTKSKEDEWTQMLEESRMYEEAETEAMWEWMEANRGNVPKGMKIPFTGHPDIDFIGLTNENNLVEICPKNFKQNNPWIKYTSHFLRKNGRMIIATDWRYKPATEEELRHKLSCFRAILTSSNLSPEQKTSIAGWMLSEMLEEIPEYKYKIDNYWKNQD